VLRIHFTVEDLARLRMMATHSPVTESVFALDLFRRRGSGSIDGWLGDDWYHLVRGRLGKHLDSVERLAHGHQPVPDLLRVMNRPISPMHRQTAITMFEFCRVAVLPYWNRARRHLNAERDMRARIVITHGVEWLLRTLNPTVSWNSPVLEFPCEPDREVHLNGRGLILSPALFLSDRRCVVVDPPGDTGRHILAFATQFGVSTVLDPLGEPDEQALGALVGHTRAAALQVLSDGCTTGELAGRLGISLAGASKHATVLRKAGLITTARYRNTALHTLTSLGVALLGKPEGAGEWRHAAGGLPARVVSLTDGRNAS
jgi:DNA-binding transcriptional ArsR family regulator